VQLTARLDRTRGGSGDCGLFAAGPDSMSDNSILSDSDRPGGGALTAADLAVSEYLRAARAPNTHRAYACDLADFQNWGGQVPSAPKEVARYLAERAPSLRPSTLRRRLAALAGIHRDQGFSDPTKATLVRRVVQGIARKHGTTTIQVAPLMIDDLERIVAKLGPDSCDARDRAILLAGFFGAFRRSELVALKVSDLVITDAGAQITIRRSKTHQLGQGRKVFLALRAGILCPVRALEYWLTAARPNGGYLFPTLLGAGNAARDHISARSVARIVKKHVASIGLDPEFYSGHSLRAGYVTSAALAGIEGPLIARQTGHRSQQSLAAYARPGEFWAPQLPSVTSGHSA